MRGVGLLAALALVSASANAQPLPEHGRIWKGTLGDEAITVCLPDERPGTGVFYADATLEPVRLEAENTAEPDTLREMKGYDDPTGAVWTLITAEDRATGEWRKGADTRRIRLTAQAVELPEYGSACGSGAFLDPVLAGGRIESSREALDGTAYTVLDYTGPQRSGLANYGVTAFALDPVRPGDAAINRALAKALPDDTAGHEAGQCLAGSLTWSNGPGDYGHLLKPELITSRWLSLTSSGSRYCGGAHPTHFLMKQVYDRGNGAEVDPGTWFKRGAVVYYEFDTVAVEGRREIAGLSEALTKAVLAHWADGQTAEDAERRRECADMIDGNSWQIGLTREGPVFVPQLPHVIFACSDEIVLPWMAARLFLSAEGLAVMASLRSAKPGAAR
ncbi:MAG: hypothetical protein O9293_08010 [Porphyrobacter sp.]|nr:hypothetical protein [Porphyrobacter sp.]